jgi:hypothetical protein
MVKPKWVVDFGHKNVEGALSLLTAQEIWAEFHERQTNKAGLVRDVIETQNNLIFAFTAYARTNIAFFNKESKNSIIGQFPDFYGTRITFLGSYNDELIGYINPHEIDRNLTGEIWPLSQNDRDILQSVTIDSNPILIRFSLNDF